MENSYNFTEKYLKNSFLLNPNSLDARILLGTMYSESDPEKFYEAYKLLLKAVEEDVNKKYIDARYTLAMSALQVGEDYVSRQSALEYKNLIQNKEDSGINDWVNFIYHRYNQYIEKDTLNNEII